MRLEVRISIIAVTAILLAVLAALVAGDLITNRIEWNRRHDLQRGYAELEFGCDVGGDCFAPRQPESLSDNLEKVRIRLDMDREGTVPTWYSSTLLTIAAAILLVIAFRSRELGQRGFYGWVFLSIATVFMSIDESISVHEQLGGDGSIGSNLNKSLGLDFINFDWVIPAMIAILIVFPLLIPFLWRLPWQTFALLVFAGMLYLGGAVALETYQGDYVRTHRFESWGYHVLSVTEETLEALGIIVLVATLLLHFKRHLQTAAAASRLAVTGAPPAITSSQPATATE